MQIKEKKTEHDVAEQIERNIPESAANMMHQKYGINYQIQSSQGYGMYGQSALKLNRLPEL